ncbi:MAG: GAF domain-containing protein [Spirulinaceae cyanobacterium SM2_1_0]|nr:GAF domain-containing protein [Spirulinaceae cyanobacterium SM2_1_0]
MESAPAQKSSMDWQGLGAELVFTQDSTGRYLSFYWEAARDRGLVAEALIGQPLTATPFVPIEHEVYLERLQRVMDRRLPETYFCMFVCGGQDVPLELAISPVLAANGGVESVLVMGRMLDREAIASAPYAALPVGQDPDNYQDFVTQLARNVRRNPYQNLVNQIVRNIRRTLDLETIWQQTVDSLGEALQVSRCLIVSYDARSEKLRVEAEFCQAPCKPMLGERLDPVAEPYLQQALDSVDPLAIEQFDDNLFEQKSALIVSTFYQNQRNALICLQQCDRVRHWSAAEIELVRELASQMGTAIAHATLYKELEQASIKAEEASRLKSEFLASTSHELRTPLNGIIGFLRLILDGMADDPQEQREFLEEAHRSAIHLLNLINDILDIAKIEAGKMEIDLSDLQLSDLFEAVEGFTRSQAQRKNLSYEIRLPATREPIVVYGNYQRLLQIMLNLVGNAIKFTHEGGVTISAEVIKKKSQINGQEFPGTVRVRVADTGIGVSLEKQSTLFQKFTQVDAGRTKAYGGTGLGLAISQKLIETMGGTINFFSMGEDLGSTVTFTMPLFQIPLMKTSD